jgi:hypothetical protein
MAKLNGIIPLKGTIGELTFRDTKFGFVVSGKSRINAGMIRTDPRFQRTRENSTEFGRAVTASKRLRSAFRSLLINVSDRDMRTRLLRQMMKVIRSDKVNPRGFRNVMNSEAELLQGFEFNSKNALVTTLNVPFTAGIDRGTGELAINIPSFVPVNDMAAPDGASHYRIIAAGSAIDFENGSYFTDIKTSGILPLDATDTAALSLVSIVPANSTKLLFLLLCIEFVQSVNGVIHPLKNGEYTALSLVAVSGNPVASTG